MLKKKQQGNSFDFVELDINQCSYLCKVTKQKSNERKAFI